MANRCGAGGALDEAQESTKKLKFEKKNKEKDN